MLVRRLAELEAERLEQYPANDAHLLLAMLTEGGGLPMHVFADVGVDLGRLRQDLLTALGVPDDLRDSYVRARTAYEHARHEMHEQLQQADDAQQHGPDQPSQLPPTD